MRLYYSKKKSLKKSKTYPLSKKDVCPGRESFALLLFIPPQFTFPEI